MDQAHPLTGANLARHLNDRYPDTVLFLARSLAARPKTTVAGIIALDRQGIQLVFRDGQHSDSIRVAFPPSTDGAVSLREQVAGLVATARTADPKGTLASLEVQMVGKPKGLQARMAALHARGR